MITAMEPHSSHTPLRILVVEDDELDRRAVCRYLQQCGIAATADQAASAEEALERIGCANFDCVLLDYYIPGVDGLSLLNLIRGAAPGVPVVIFTGRGDEDIAVELMKAGAADYLPKVSLTAERLASSLRHAMELRSVGEARQRVEEELRAQEARFRTLANAIPQLAWMTDASGARNWFNDRWYEYTGTTFEEIQGWGWEKVHHPDHVQRVIGGIRRSIETGEPWEDSHPLRGKDGTFRWFLSRALPIRGEDGSIARWLGTNTDITEQKAAGAERERLLALEREARIQAEHATRARDDILAIVAHDLRNPMQTILTAATMIKLRGKDEDSRNHNVSLIQRSIKEMERQISDLLDVARIEGGSLAIRQERVDVRALISETLELFGPQAHEKEIKITGEIPANLQALSGDRDRLVQVLSNLIGNALKFTTAGGRISLRAGALEGAVQISVEDSGTGISAAHLPHVFDRYWQVDRLSRNGAGLGLPICKGIVEAHGGRIWVESAVGRGTTFHFTVPCAED
jgi:PAS domain S-box-containing protein